MASSSEAGSEALEQGRIDDAIRHFSEACAENRADFGAHMGLAAAYAASARHEDAVSALTSAVHIRPADASARYNLAVALEKAGREPQALEAFRQAARLDPSRTEASDAAVRLEQAGFVTVPGAPAASHQAQPSAPTQELDLAALTAAHDRPDPQSAPPAPGFVASAPTGLAGALPSHGLLSDYSPSPNSPNGPTAVPEAYPSTLPPPNYNDEIDIPETIRDFGRLLIMPDRVLRRHAGRNGLMSPMVMIGVYLAIQLITILISNGGQGLFTFVLGLVVSPISLAMAGAWMLTMYLISALFVHFVGWCFGNRQDYSVSVRACVYADAPRFAISLILTAYMTIFIVPSFRANPITPAEIEQEAGLPPGFLTNGGYNPTVTAVPTAEDGATTTPARSAGAKRKPASSPASTPPPAAPTAGSGMTPAAMVQIGTGVAHVVWRRIGVVMIVWTALALGGWFWCSALLALGIHRLQGIPAVSAAAVVVLIYATALALFLLLLFALRQPIGQAIHFFAQALTATQSAPGPGS